MPSKKSIFISFFILVFGVLFFITYIKTKDIKIKKEIIEDFEEFYIQKQLDGGIVLEPIIQTPPQENEDTIEYVVKFGDTLESIFASFEFENSDYRKVINLIHEKLEGMKIYAGQKLNITYKTVIEYSPYSEIQDEFMPSFESKNQTNIFQKLGLQTGEQIVEISRAAEGFEIKLIPFQKLTKTKFVKVPIKTSVYQDGIEAGISGNVIENLTRLYSFDIDFQRDIREGDSFEILYAEIYDEITGRKLRDGNILFSKIHLTKNGTKSFEYYLFKNEYYDGAGKASAKSFLRTPVPAGRLTSKFGLRRHPILGFTRLHAGIDFAAPRGTPIFAAASGVIEFIGWNGGPKTGYGKLVIIKHGNGYSTLYAHMNGFRGNLHKGSKVRQGEVIGYVGSTGYSTGPHLHYEVIKNGKKINPSTITAFSVKALSSEDLAKFANSKQEIINKLNEFKE